MKQEEYIKHIYEAIENVLCISEEMLKSPKRTAKHNDARKIFSYLCREQGMTFLRIAEILNRDHATIMYQVDTFTEFIKFDKILREKFFNVKLYIDNNVSQRSNE